MESKKEEEEEEGDVVVGDEGGTKEMMWMRKGSKLRGALLGRKEQMEDRVKES